MSTASCQIGAARAPAPPRTVKHGVSSRTALKHLKEMLFGLVLSVFAAAIVFADEIPQGWVPEAIALPGDAEIVMDREIGSGIRMFSFSTGADVEALFGVWTAALEEDGYEIRPQPAGFDVTAIEFSGGALLNAKIATGAPTEGDRVVITFDATLQ